jgi:hypothetical protein
MATREMMLQKLVQFGDRQPEDLGEDFPADPPSAGGWPKDLPTSPAVGVEPPGPIGSTEARSSRRAGV